MGMQFKSWFIAALILTTLSMVFVGGINILAFMLVVYKNTDPSILIVSFVAFTYSTFMQATVLFLVFDQFGIIILFILNLIGMIVLTVLGFIVMIPSSITAWFAFV